uniref:Uncharacterized protein n=1 Tax=Anopheles atroparvus TaxID=41427 RepID=A0A182JKQ8_ANOAO
MDCKLAGPRRAVTWRWTVWMLLIGGLCETASAQSGGQILREGFDLQKCGVPRVKGIHSRVTHGDLAIEGDWPWHGGLFYLDEYECGCTLINELFVLTASHCVYNSGTGYRVSERILRVKLGMYRLSANASEQMQVHTVQAIISHAKFVPSSHKHDVALLRLNGTVQFTEHIKPVCLDLTESIWVEYLADVLGTVVGWGITEKNRISDELLAAQLPIVRYTDCVERDPTTYGPLIYSGMYCAGILNGTSPCNGDSGGGMYIFRENRWFLRGIVSFASIRSGTNFCDSFSYVVFMNVPYYAKWISTEVDAARESLPKEAESLSPKANVSSRWDSELAGSDDVNGFHSVRMDTHDVKMPLQQQTPTLKLHGVRQYQAGEYRCQAAEKSNQLYESGLLLEVSNVPVRFRQAGLHKSYAVYDAPKAADRAATQFSLEMTFKTNETDGLLFHKPPLADVESWSYSLMLERSRLTFRMVPPGQSELVIRSIRLHLVPDRWTTVLISSYDGQGFLALDGQFLLGFEGHLLQHRLDRYYIAGIPQQLTRGISTTGFNGCVSQLMVNEQELQLERDVSEAVGVELCDDCPPEECTDGASANCPVEQNSCINYVCSGGRCGHMDAQSPERTCDLQSDTDLDGLRFQHNSYVSYRSFLSVPLSVELQFRLDSLQDGILFHTAEHRRGYGQFFTILHKAGRIELRFTTDAHLTTIYMESTVPLAMGRWHRLEAGYSNDYVYLQVDDERKVERSVNGKIISTQRQLVVFVGGVRWKGFINRQRDVKKGLDGCIKGLKISGLPVDMVDDMVESANIRSC